MDETPESKPETDFSAKLNQDGTYTVVVSGVTMEVKDLQSLIDLLTLMNI